MSPLSSKGSDWFSGYRAPSGGHSLAQHDGDRYVFRTEMSGSLVRSKACLWEKLLSGGEEGAFCRQEGSPPRAASTQDRIRPRTLAPSEGLCVIVVSA